MKNIFSINRALTILGIAISLTFWGGIIALPILGLIQIIMCIVIFKNKSNLNTKTRKLFYTYIIITLSLAGTFRVLAEIKGMETLMLLFVWMFVSVFLALFHLYITYQIQKSND